MVIWCWMRQSQHNMTMIVQSAALAICGNQAPAVIVDQLSSRPKHQRCLTAYNMITGCPVSSACLWFHCQHAVEPCDATCCWYPYVFLCMHNTWASTEYLKGARNGQWQKLEEGEMALPSKGRLGFGACQDVGQQGLHMIRSQHSQHLCKTLCCTASLHTVETQDICCIHSSAQLQKL